MEDQLLLKVTERDLIAEDVLALTISSEDGAELPGWKPGAHIDLELETGLVRQYSLCGDRGERHSYRVAVLNEPNSRGGSRFVHSRLHVGHTLNVRGPRNHFALESSPRYLFIAGGIGITPILPMIDEVNGRGLEWRLVYGGRNRRSMAFVDDLVGRYAGRVDIWPQDVRGLIDLSGLLDEPVDDTLIYCCGPEGLLAAVEDGSRKWPKTALHVERFAAKPSLGAGEGRSFEVELARTGCTVTVSQGVSIIDAIASAGVEIPFSCREGVCGTCETPVLGGVPDHRDSVLTDEERQACDVILPCVSRALTEKLVLDL
ncbi:MULTISPECIES: PDR/VanB family oxidoreductase [unclassified Mycolicibacterium]|uniref:PDR/VanB family oxidoreductase n=1 Tax=unclassified Mycolicibacterium TaxID=2636767 RepID=UPI00192E73B2|nr:MULTISPECIES: PDR/VanB family oxidoreductase [unclassified Mycolicibacterium]